MRTSNAHLDFAPIRCQDFEPAANHIPRILLLLALKKLQAEAACICANTSHRFEKLYKVYEYPLVC